MQTNKVPEKELSILNPDQQVAGREKNNGPGLSIRDLKAFPQLYTSSNKATPYSNKVTTRNSTTSYGPILGPFSFKPLHFTPCTP